ncbi:MAG TPA: hypothetical protein VLV54_16430, partial [Thermoanaerobaculia bacterium]|nr:hypothetical protein [Thermoanaerobaculia bacterium]
MIDSAVGTSRQLTLHDVPVSRFLVQFPLPGSRGREHELAAGSREIGSGIPHRRGYIDHYLFAIGELDVDIPC